MDGVAARPQRIQIQEIEMSQLVLRLYFMRGRCTRSKVLVMEINGFAVGISNAITIHDSRAHERQTLDENATTAVCDAGCTGVSRMRQPMS